MPTHYSMLLFVPLFCVGMLLPGVLLHGYFARRISLFWGFVCSAPILVNLVLLYDAVGLPLDLRGVLAGLLLFSGVIVLALLRQEQVRAGWLSKLAHAGLRGLRRLWEVMRERGNWLWLAGLGFCAATLVLKLLHLPLSGWDHAFRWDFLAQQILRFHTLSFYPVHEPSDFAVYLWCDGIPPLVSLHQWWGYESMGSYQVWGSTPRVLLEGALLFWGTGRLAGRLGGAGAILPAMVILGSSAVALWTLTIGQETVLTAVALVGMLGALEDGGLPEGWRFALAGLAAGLGALSREYGLSWIVLGLFVLGIRGELRRGWQGFLFTALLACGPWYLRNWLLTGNPLFPHTIGGLFPGNAVHEETMEIIRSYCSPLLDPLKFCSDIVRAAPGYAMPLLLAVFGWVLCRRKWRSLLPVGLGMGWVGLLWLVSVQDTAGGWGYSLRVLLPALALASVLGAQGVARLRPSARGAAAALLGCCVFISGLRSFYLPTQHQPSFGECFSDEWRTRGKAFAGFFVNAGWTEFIRQAQPGIFLVDEPACQAALIEQGAACTLSLFSPELDFLFDEGLRLEDQLQQLRRLRVRYLVLSPGNTISDRRALRHHFFGEMQRRYLPTRTLGFNAVYDLFVLRGVPDAS